MKTLIFCAFIAISMATQAAELEFGLITHHWKTRGLNENNHLVGVEWRGVEASTFVNSYEDRSYSLGYRFEIGLGWSVSVGAIHGYGENAKWFPIRAREMVFYPMINYTASISDHFSFRFRAVTNRIFLATFTIHVKDACSN